MFHILLSYSQLSLIHRCFSIFSLSKKKRLLHLNNSFIHGTNDIFVRRKFFRVIILVSYHFIHCKKSYKEVVYVISLYRIKGRLQMCVCGYRLIFRMGNSSCRIFFHVQFEVIVLYTQDIDVNLQIFF